MALSINRLGENVDTTYEINTYGVYRKLMYLKVTIFILSGWIGNTLRLRQLPTKPNPMMTADVGHAWSSWKIDESKLSYRNHVIFRTVLSVSHNFPNSPIGITQFSEQPYRNHTIFRTVLYGIIQSTIWGVCQCLPPSVVDRRRESVTWPYNPFFGLRSCTSVKTMDGHCHRYSAAPMMCRHTMAR